MPKSPVALFCVPPISVPLSSDPLKLCYSPFLLRYSPFLLRCSPFLLKPHSFPLNASLRSSSGLRKLSKKGDDNTKQKKRNFPWKHSYSKMTLTEAQQRLGFRIQTLRRVSVEEMLREGTEGAGMDAFKETKGKVYDQIMQYLEIEGYPTEAEADFKEANINDLVYATISPILRDFIRGTGQKGIQLRREKEIVGVDEETGGYEEFVVVDLISLTGKKIYSHRGGKEKPSCKSYEAMPVGDEGYERQ
ncbi:hypothetical protein BGX38DRAFT_1159115 [Terfezia claveryi]|nr:hypothetical protein BGX38DRAFT_1159115 [Terfezia claveryi]